MSTPNNRCCGSTGSNGEIENVAIALESCVADIVIKRIEEKKSTAANLQ